MSPVSSFRRLVAAMVRELNWRVGLAVAVSLALALTEGAGLLLLIPLLGSIGLAVDDGTTGKLAATVTRGFAALGLAPNLLSVLAVFIATSTAHALLYRVNLLLQPDLEQRFARALRSRLYRSIVRAEWSFFIARRASDLVHAVTTQVDRASSAAYQLLTLVTGAAVSTVYLALAFRLSPLLTALVSAVGLGVLWVVRGRTRRSTEMGERYVEADRRQFHMAAESISGIKVAKTLGAEQRDIEIFNGYVRARSDAYLDMLRAFARAKFGLDVFSAVVVSVLLFLAVEWLGLRGAGLLVLIFVFARVMPRVMALQQSAETLAGGLPAFTSVRQLLKEAEGHAERSAGGGSSRLALREAISLDRISFAYTAGGPAVLRQVSMSIPAGRTTAIVGASGAGKSTLADILIGLLQPTGGRLEVDGQPLSGGDLPAWRRSVGYVPQESFLLHDTIRKNLLWAKPDATDADMWDALARAAAGGFVRARPDGLDAVVGDRGLRLSGGERQRLALARALLTQPVLLVLDEATSALDSINEQQILASVRNLRESATTLIITHRLSAVRHADLIYVLENGQIEASGTWDELVKKPGVFGAMLSAQGSYSPVSELPGFPLAVAGPPAISTRATAIHGQWPSDSS